LDLIVQLLNPLKKGCDWFLILLDGMNVVAEAVNDFSAETAKEACIDSRLVEFKALASFDHGVAVGAKQNFLEKCGCRPLVFSGFMGHGGSLEYYHEIMGETVIIVGSCDDVASMSTSDITPVLPREAPL
jgi:hypothetical protein